MPHKLVWLLGQTVPGQGQNFVQLGVIAVALITGQILVYKYIILPERQAAKDREAAMALRIERQEAEIKRLNEVTQDKALPALITGTNTIAECQKLLVRFHEELLSMRRGNG